MDDGVVRAERLVGEVLVPRADGPGRQADAIAAVEALLRRAGVGDPAAVDAVRRMAMRRDVVVALGIPIRSYIAVLPDGWVYPVVEIQGLEPEDLFDLAGAPRLVHLQPGLLAAALDRCVRPRHAAVAAEVLRAEALPLESVAALLADERRCRALGLEPPTVVLALGDSRGPAFVNDRWTAEDLELLGRSDPGPLVAAAVSESLVRQGVGRSDVERILRAAAFGGPDGRRRSQAAAAGVAERQIAAAMAELQSRNRRRQVAAVEAIERADRLLRDLDRLDAPPSAELQRAKQLAARAHQALQQARPALARASLAEALKRGPGMDFVGWRREVEHLARCADTLAATADIGEDLARLGAEARIAIVTAAARPPHRIWMLGSGSSQVCAWCGSWAGADWRHCGGCGANRAF